VTFEEMERGLPCLISHRGSSCRVRVEMATISSGLKNKTSISHVTDLSVVSIVAARRVVVDQCPCYLATFLCTREDSRLDEEISRETHRFLLEHIRFRSTVSCQSNTVENRRSASRSSNFSIGR
jgi:hypothetical protein